MKPEQFARINVIEVIIDGELVRFTGDNLDGCDPAHVTAFDKLADVIVAEMYKEFTDDLI